MHTGTPHKGEHAPSEDACWLSAPSGGKLLKIHAWCFDTNERYGARIGT
jgi:hypothetical protein